MSDLAGVKHLRSTINTVRGELSRLRWQALWAIAPRRTVRSRGLTFTLQRDNWITQYRYDTYNTKEPETLDWIDTWMRDGDLFFDIGANIGVYTIYAALRHRLGRVVAFEPEYANLHLLRDNIIENGLQDAVEVYAVGLSNRSGISYLHIQDFTPGAALHTESRRPLERTLTGHPVVWREGIWTLTLDAFCEETSLQPHCVKIDVDGTELNILEGATRTLASPQLRSVLVELSPEESVRQGCAQLLGAAGLRRHWRDPLGNSDNEIWLRDES